MTALEHAGAPPRDPVEDRRVAELKRRIKRARHARDVVALAAPELAHTLSRVCRQGQVMSDYLSVLEATRVAVQSRWGFAAYREAPASRQAAAARQRKRAAGGRYVRRRQGGAAA